MGPSWVAESPRPFRQTIRGCEARQVNKRGCCAFQTDVVKNLRPLELPRLRRYPKHRHLRLDSSEQPGPCA